jgi:hypothetical protein
MIAVFTSQRFQPLSDLSLSIIATLIIGTKPHQVLKENPTFGSIDPRGCVSHSFLISCAVQGTLDVTVVAHFKFEESPHTVTATERISILPSLHIFYAERPRLHNFLQVSVQNLFPFRMTNVRVRTPSGDGVLIAASHENQDKASAFFRVTKTDSASLEFTWSLPFALKCVQNVRLKDKPPEGEPNPIVLTLEGVPQTSPALQQIDIVARITNTTDEILRGEIVIANNNQGLLSVGKTDLRFDGLAPNEVREIPLSFISLYQGYFPFPAFTFELGPGKTFVHESGAGLLVIGYAQ